MRHVPEQPPQAQPTGDPLGLPVERRSLGEQVAARIKAMILAGHWAGGKRISEEALAAEFEVSRTPVREALRQLADYGLVRIKPRSYAEVAWLEAAEQQDVVEVRGAVERLAAERLARHATSDDVQALRDLTEQCREALARGDVAGMFEGDSVWHLELTRRSGNTALYEVMQRLDAKVQLVRLARCTDAGHMAPMLAQHEGIIQALERHDEAAAGRLMELHARGYAGPNGAKAMVRSAGPPKGRVRR